MAQINKPDLYFNTKLYTGNLSTNNITGVGFQPDLVWLKSRAQGTTGYNGNHYLFDAVRGATNWIISNQTGAEANNASSLSSFDSDGFTLGALDFINNNGDGFASWNWLADNTSGSSNTDGSITSTVSANTTSGFSIVSFTVPSSGTFTVGHGLTVKPGLIITKGRGSADNWVVYHKSISSSNEDDYINLNTTDATSTITDIWGTAQPTSTVVGMNAGQTLIGSQNAIAYCFAEKKGFSKFGSYTGNGYADGTFVYTGFKPAWFLIKRTDTTSNWLLFDNKRAYSYNLISATLKPDTSGAEDTNGAYNNVDFISNGIKLRQSNGDLNASGGTYIYMAFAENPLVGTNNIPATAR
jgi:hypothetical protein